MLILVVISESHAHVFDLLTLLIFTLFSFSIFKSNIHEEAIQRSKYENMRQNIIVNTDIF